MKQLGPFVCGYSVNIGSDGKPQIGEFGNIQLRKRIGRFDLDIKDKREPLADVITFDDEIQVVIELPGVEKKDIKLRGTEDSIIVSVETPKRKYYIKLIMPMKVDLETANSSFKNGVLEVILQKMKKEPNGGKLKIE